MPDAPLTTPDFSFKGFEDEFSLTKPTTIIVTTNIAVKIMMIRERELVKRDLIFSFFVAIVYNPSILSCMTLPCQETNNTGDFGIS